MTNKLNLVIVRNEFNNYSLKNLPKGYQEDDCFNGLTLKGLIYAVASLVSSEMEKPMF